MAGRMPHLRQLIVFPHRCSSITAVTQSEIASTLAARRETGGDGRYVATLPATLGLNGCMGMGIPLEWEQYM